MSRVFVIILLINFSPLCIGDVSAVERDWLDLDKRDSWMFYTGTALLVVDTLQSRYIADAGLEETNIFQGRTPRRSTIYSYNIAIITLNYAINRFADNWLKYAWNSGLFTVQIWAINNNHANGLRVYMEF